jgi:hypothetical protein
VRRLQRTKPAKVRKEPFFLKAKESMTRDADGGDDLRGSPSLYYFSAIRGFKVGHLRNNYKPNAGI